MQQQEIKPSYGRLRGADREHAAREVLARWTASGLTRTAFCRQAGLAPVTLRRWLAEFGTPEQGTPPRFIEARLPAASACAAFEVEFVDGVRLRVPPGFDPADLEPLVQALRRC